MTRNHGPGRGWPWSLAAALLVLVAAEPGVTQTDHNNTAQRRRVRIVDVHPAEHRSLVLQIAPFELELEEDVELDVTLTPELFYGILPSTHVGIAIPVALNDVGSTSLGDVSLEGIDLQVLHKLKEEGRGLPAVSVRVDLWVPAGGLSPEKVHPALTGLMTRGFGRLRLHVNAQYTFVDEDDSNASELSRWLVGAAVDRSYLHRSLLVSASFSVNEPLGEGVQYNGNAGIRHKVNSRLALDAGLSGTLAGEDDSSVSVTFGGAYTLVRARR